MDNPNESESWAIVELMGHAKMAGRLSEEERFGAKMGRVDIPSPNDSGGFTTVYFGGSSVYRITAVPEGVARVAARSNQPRPVYEWELPPGPPKALESSATEGFGDYQDD